MAKDGGSLMTLLLVGGAAYLGYKYFFAPGETPALPAASPTPTPAMSTGTNVPGQLTTIFNNLVNAATSDYNAGDRENQLALINGVPQTTWGAWNYFMGKVAPNLSGLPDYQSATGNPDPGTAITGAQYWAVMGPWLTKNKGLSGAMQGLGALYRMGVVR